MLTKTQKVWLWISAAIFLVPEILWSPVANFYYQLTQTSRSGGTYPFRNNFLQNSDNLNYLKLVFFLQFVGLLWFLISMLRGALIKNKVIKYICVATLLILLIVVGFALYFAMTFSIEIL